MRAMLIVLMLFVLGLVQGFAFGLYISNTRVTDVVEICHKSN